MDIVEIFKQYLEYLFAGQRCGARELIFDAHDRGMSADKILSTLIWPAMEQIDRLYREDHINRVTEHMATRINRMIADQMHMVLNRRPKDGRRIVVLCGEDQHAELGAQIASDLFEAEGWTVWFVGSGVPNDEVLRFISDIDPDILFIHASLPPEVPQVRHLITLIREVGICKDMQVMVCGGIYNRAEDLAEEIKADLFAHNVREALLLAHENPKRVPKVDKPEPGRRRKRKRRRQSSRIAELRRELGLGEDEKATVAAGGDETVTLAQGVDDQPADDADE